MAGTVQRQRQKGRVVRERSVAPLGSASVCCARLHAIAACTLARYC
jgi:hypothetical protein